MSDERTDEEKARSKRVHALVMIVLGAIMSACALMAGLIALHPGAFPSWMIGGWFRSAEEPYRRPGRMVVSFVPWSDDAFQRAKEQKQLVLLHVNAPWSTEGRVMEETTYADPEATALISTRFVPVRLDVDDPRAAAFDIGALPVTALLLPDGRPVAAAARLTPRLFRAWAEAIADGLRERPEKADDLAEDAARRFAAVRGLPKRAPADFALDPVWGGVYHAPGEYAKLLADQAAVVASTDAARALAALKFADEFLALPGGGWAASAAGEVPLADGRLARGAYYFSQPDDVRRALGLPDVDKRFLPGPNAAMGKAVLACPVASSAQKARARAALKRAAR